MDDAPAVLDRRELLKIGVAAGATAALAPASWAAAGGPATSTAPSGLLRDLLHVAREQDVSFLGIADMAPARGLMQQRLSAFYPRAIAIGVTMQFPAIDSLPDSGKAYTNYFYSWLMPRLDAISVAFAQVLLRRGHTALVQRAIVDKQTILGVHKMAARLAGLGWIGKSCLLITPQAGPRVGWGTVLTDAPLEPTGSPMKRRCGECTRCLDICPARAFTGVPFKESDPIEFRYDTHACLSIRQQLGYPGKGDCCVCVSVCPFGQASSLPEPPGEAPKQ